jgi:putative flippase GtrA
MSGDKLYCVGVAFAMSLVLTLACTLARTLAITHATTVAALLTTRFSFRHNPRSPFDTF